MKAKPELVVASALNPSAASTRAEPASHGLGTNRGSHVPGNVARNERILSGGGADDGRFSGKFGEAHYATPSEPVVTWHRNQRWSHPDQLPAAGASSRWTLGRQA